MARLKHFQRDQVRNWFCPEPGYVLDFTNRTFAEFFEDHFEVNIYSDTFSEKGTSKFNRLLAFIDVAPPHLVIELLKLLWARKNAERDDNIEAVRNRLHMDDFTITVEHLEALVLCADLEDKPFDKLISDLASMPSHNATPHLERLSADWTLDTLDREFRRAFESVESDPEAAVTAACAMLESIFRSILIAREITLPKNLDIKTLYKAAREPLGISPDKNVYKTEIEADVRTVLAAIGNTIQGIGALRTHAGTAHGRERGFGRIDPRIARLAVNASSAIALFLVETWEKRFPEDKLSSGTAGKSSVRDIRS